MNTLDRYLYRTVLLYTLMTMAVLLALAALVLFISEQGDIGVGTYSAGDAFLFTLLNLPQTAFELLPIGALIGALMGLGNLAAGSELVVTRASGAGRRMFGAKSSSVLRVRSSMMGVHRPEFR